MKLYILISIILFFIFYKICFYKNIDNFTSRKNKKFINIKLIHLPRDNWKLIRFRKSLIKNNLNLNYDIWNGINLNEDQDILNWAIKNNFTVSPSQPKLKGNLGSALAHLTLWDWCSRQNNNNPILIMEDNVLFTPYTISGINFFSQINFDFLNMCVLRPKGQQISGIPGLLRIIKQSDFNETMRSNVWLSSYLIKPEGARKILKLFPKYNFDLSDTIIDWALSRILNDNSDNILSYVVNHKKFFDHVETNNDSRRYFNG